MLGTVPSVLRNCKGENFNDRIGAILIQDFANKFPDKVASLCCIGGYDINNFDPALQK